MNTTQNDNSKAVNLYILTGIIVCGIFIVAIINTLQKEQKEQNTITLADTYSENEISERQNSNESKKTSEALIKKGEKGYIELEKLLEGKSLKEILKLVGKEDYVHKYSSTDLVDLYYYDFAVIEVKDVPLTDMEKHLNGEEKRQVKNTVDMRLRFDKDSCFSVNFKLE